MSGSADRTVKLWDLRNTEEAVSTLSLEKPVEDFCLRGNTQQVYIASGNTLCQASYENDKLELLGNFSAF
jgi:WD40 repeat protein